MSSLLLSSVCAGSGGICVVWNLSVKGAKLKYWKVLTVVIVGLVIVRSYVPLTHAAPKVEFSIIYTNDVMGEVEPCG